MTRFLAFLTAGASVLALSSAVQAADLIIEEPIVDPVIVDTSNWDGFYLGVFGGFAAGEAYDFDGENFVDLDGNWTAGINAGFDFTLTDGFVVGIVADAQYLGLEGILQLDPAQAVSYDLYWAGSLRGKVGFDGGAFLPYLTGGLAIAQGEVQASGPISGAVSNTHVGWTVGAGVEFAFTEDLSLDLLYRYTDYGTQDYDVGVFADPEVGFTTHAVTAGVNWRF